MAPWIIGAVALALLVPIVILALTPRARSRRDAVVSGAIGDVGHVATFAASDASSATSACHGDAGASCADGGGSH